MNVTFSQPVADALSEDQQSRFSDEVHLWYEKAANLINVQSPLTFTVKVAPAHYGATGLGGFAHNKHTIDLNLSTALFDLALEKGIPTAVPHETHHVVRGYLGDSWKGSAIEAAIAEGLASVFETEVSGIITSMSSYQDEVTGWVGEMMELGPDWSYSDWFTGPNKGRWYVGYKVGRYIVDRAIRNAPNETAVTLVNATPKEILRMAGFTAVK
jgi:uncharacterized protein YjaZ